MSAPDTTGPACYREKFTGVYKTFTEDPNTIGIRWTLVHPGPCQCEGRTAPDCIEPGDDGG